jgi:hypothetical protein
MSNSTATQAWSERKATLKKEICEYFFSQEASNQSVIKACEHIKVWGEVQVEVANMDGKLTPTTPNDDYVADSFSPQHRAKVAEWINRYAELHKEAVNFLEAQRNYGEKTNWARDDFEQEDWESTQPDGEIQVHSDCIEVYAFGYKEGFAASLPKQGKKSVGKTDGGYKWEYPLIALDLLKSTGLPVLYSIDAKQ